MLQNTTIVKAKVYPEPIADVIEWKCPECEKEISSTNKKQFNYNKEQHIQFHKRKLNTSKEGNVK